MDKGNFDQLMGELRQALGSKTMLTASVGATRDVLQASYDIPALYEKADFVTVSAYDYHGKN